MADDDAPAEGLAEVRARRFLTADAAGRTKSRGRTPAGASGGLRCHRWRLIRACGASAQRRGVATDHVALILPFGPLAPAGEAVGQSKHTRSQSAFDRRGLRTVSRQGRHRGGGRVEAALCVRRRRNGCVHVCLVQTTPGATATARSRQAPNDHDYGRKDFMTNIESRTITPFSTSALGTGRQANADCVPGQVAGVARGPAE
jgi:hypothetical protein